MNKDNLGISVYIGLSDYPINKTLEYLDIAAINGIKIVFTSAHIPESDNAFSDLQAIIKKTTLNKQKLIIDVSKPMYEKVLPYIDNIYALRLDWGFSDEEIITMSHEQAYYIELNASTFSCEHLERLISKGLVTKRVRMSYNFYPKKYTGLDINTLIEKNKYFKHNQFRIMAYIPSKTGKRPPLYEGLPSVEAHRNLDTRLALYELFLSGCDEVAIGDAYASSEEIQELSKFELYPIVIPCKLYGPLSKEERIIFDKIHTSRTDQSPYMIRSSTRINDKILPRNNKKTIVPFEITIDNYLFKRYQGELGIALKNMEALERVNVIGIALDKACDILKMLPPGTKFKLEETND